MVPAFPLANNSAPTINTTAPRVASVDDLYEYKFDGFDADVIVLRN
jgi:hypothetical protein